MALSIVQAESRKEMSYLVAQSPSRGLGMTNQTLFLLSENVPKTYWFLGFCSFFLVVMRTKLVYSNAWNFGKLN